MVRHRENSQSAEFFLILTDCLSGPALYQEKSQAEKGSHQSWADDIDIALALDKKPQGLCVTDACRHVERSAVYLPVREMF